MSIFHTRMENINIEEIIYDLQIVDEPILKILNYPFKNTYVLVLTDLAEKHECCCNGCVT